jgi:hypothetical protein
MKRVCDTVFIVGAGFSKHAGLPLQANFTEALLDARDTKSVSGPLVELLREFVHRTFDHSKTAPSKYWPLLEDIFTSIDLSANTGHHLGPADSPRSLRTMRRVLLSRMMWMLEEQFEAAANVPRKELKRLDAFFSRIDVESSVFVSINWDVVIERKLAALRGINRFEYCCGAVRAVIPSDAANACSPVTLIESSADSARVIKMHGSVNWLYCDNCRQLYWFDPQDAKGIARQLISHDEAVTLRFPDCWGEVTCPDCTDVRLTTRIATFSMLKSLEFPMFQKSWFSAERTLRKARKWVFIGYSLPLADFEFKHLLKRVQLSRSSPPEFVIITGGSPSQIDATYRNYQGFFGRSIKRKRNFFEEGLSSKAVDAALSL